MGIFENMILTALLGGVLIGAAIGGLSLFTGRIVSGASMVGALLGGAEGVAATSIAFIGGLVMAALMMTSLGFAPSPATETGLPLLVLGGLLVGASARWGGASLGGVLTGIARRAPHAITTLLILLTGATLGGILQRILGGLGA